MRTRWAGGVSHGTLGTYPSNKQGGKASGFASLTKPLSVRMYVRTYCAAPLPLPALLAQDPKFAHDLSADRKDGKV